MGEDGPMMKIFLCTSRSNRRSIPTPVLKIRKSDVLGDVSSKDNRGKKRRTGDSCRWVCPLTTSEDSIHVSSVGNRSRPSPQVSLSVCPGGTGLTSMVVCPPLPEGCSSGLTPVSSTRPKSPVGKSDSCLEDVWGYRRTEQSHRRIYHTLRGSTTSPTIPTARREPPWV